MRRPVPASANLRWSPPAALLAACALRPETGLLLGPTGGRGPPRSPGARPRPRRAGRGRRGLPLGILLSGPSRDLGIVAESAAVYRPRHPERTSFYRLLEAHFERYVEVHEERYELRSGPLRPVVRTSVDAFLECGRLTNGFARIRCPTCKAEHLLAFSCRVRNFCPSCPAKRAALFAEKLREEILAPVPHRHWVFTIPRVLRGLFERERRLLGMLSRSAFDAVRLTFAKQLGRPDVVPGCVASLQTFGAYANFHPHVHALVTDGVFTPAGAFLPLPEPDAEQVEQRFRRLLLRRLHRAGRLSEEFRDQLLSWVRPGFSVRATQVVEPDDPERLERLARYVVRAPFLQDGARPTPEGPVVVPTPPDPRTGAEELHLDPLDWVHAVTTQIPDPAQHLVRYYGGYASRTRGTRRRREAATAGPRAPEHHGHPLDRDEDSAFTKARKATWARLLRKLLEVDPLICPRCGAEMKVIAVITEPRVVDEILRHLAQRDHRDPFGARPPPPPPEGLQHLSVEPPA